jgi:hypothetical protein
MKTSVKLIGLAGAGVIALAACAPAHVSTESEEPVAPTSR